MRQLIILLFIFISFKGFPTHLMGGEIFAERTSTCSLTYTFTLNLF